MQLGKRHIAHHIFIAIRVIAFVDGGEIEQIECCRAIVAIIDAHKIIVGEFQRVGGIEFLILVAIIIELCSDVAQHGRTCWKSAGTLSKHKLLVIEQPFNHHPIEFIFHTIYILLLR